jgi:hypothetical protein
MTQQDLHRIIRLSILRRNTLSLSHFRFSPLWASAETLSYSGQAAIAPYALSAGASQQLVNPSSKDPALKILSTFITTGIAVISVLIVRIGFTQHTDMDSIKQDIDTLRALATIADVF